MSKVTADSVLGRDLILQFKLDKILLSSSCNAIVSDATLNKLFLEFPNVFTGGLGCCTQVQAHLQLKADAVSAVQRKIPAPYAI